jgi:hypothetical protein
VRARRVDRMEDVISLCGCYCNKHVSTADVAKIQTEIDIRQYQFKGCCLGELP